MRWLTVLLLVAGSAARAEAPRTAADGFAHRIHDLKLQTAALESLPCASCHVLSGGKVIGKPTHATCFTAACHAPRPKSGKLCEVCHSEAALAMKQPAVFYPPFSIDRDFRVQLGHATHTSAGCATCHLAKPAPVHARCLGCHDGTKTFAMTRCEPCHVAASGDPKPPRLQPAVYLMKSSFSHDKHAARGPAGKACLTCHQTLAQSNDQFLPRPAAQTCGQRGCHDGGAAFAVTNACTRCHVDPATAIERPKLERFRHQLHDLELPCAKCHTVAGSEVASAGHAACVDCHAAEFGMLKPRICLACHNSIEPWRHLIVDRLPPLASELGVDLDHAKHDRPCGECHQLDTASRELRPARGHSACSGCHLATSGPAPHLVDCTGCHAFGIQSERDIARHAAPWSVRRSFRHGTHKEACTACHVDMSATRVANLATPTKATCARCHQGGVAFKLTGTTCSRCHL